MKYMAPVLLFTFCQVIGTMCALPDLLMADATDILAEEGMVCPMDGMLMCPPSITSSPEREMKNSMDLQVDHVTIVLSSAAVLTARSVPTHSSWSSAYSLVPISIASSSVLRI